MGHGGATFRPQLEDLLITHGYNMDITWINDGKPWMGQEETPKPL